MVVLGLYESQHVPRYVSAVSRDAVRSQQHHQRRNVRSDHVRILRHKFAVHVEYVRGSEERNTKKSTAGQRMFPVRSVWRQAMRERRGGRLSTPEMQKFDLCASTLPRVYMYAYVRTYTHALRVYIHAQNMQVYVYSICMYVHIGLHIDLACISRDEAWTMMHGRSACVRKHSVSFPSTIFFSWPDFYQCFIDRVIRNEKVRPNSDADSANPHDRIRAPP